MSFQPVLISSFNSGLTKDKKPFLLMDDAFQQIKNAYAWRGSVKKREGVKLVGRLRRCITPAVTLTNQASGTTYSVADIFADNAFLLRTTEPNAEIEPGGVTVTIGALTFTDPGKDGLLTQSGDITAITQANPASVTSATHNLATGNIVNISGVTGMTGINGGPYTITVTGVNTFTLDGTTSVPLDPYTGPSGTWAATQATSPNTGTINYASGKLDLAFAPAIGATNVDIAFCYFPSLPAMGISKRELAAINSEKTTWFDTKYVYSYDGNDFSVSSTGTTWSGSDSDFFWTENYRGLTANIREFFATNNAAPALNTNNRIRHTTDASTWTDFVPAVAGTQITNEGFALDVVTPWTSYTNTIVNTPIIPGTVTITVSNSPTNPIVGFRDQVGVYPAGTLNGSANTNSGTIDYTTGVFSLTITPAMTADATVTVTYQYETSYLFQAKLIVAYYGRLLAFNVYEGLTAGATTNIFNRCRFSQTGNPLQQDAWVSTTPGKGGFIDAPTNEAIVSAQFYKNTLIVFFERSTWELRYVGEYGLPFLWERISSDYGSESTFSTVLFDNGVMAVGDKALVSSSGNNVQRMDNDIPDQVLSFNNKEGGKERVHGVRDFAKELVYWTYSDGGLATKFPNRVLLFNYKNGAYSIFRDNVTVLGELTTATGVQWDLPISWDTEMSWDTVFPSEFPMIISGNAQGWIHWYQYPDTETTADSVVNMNENESLSITNITLSASADIILEIINHNLEQNEIIYVAGLLFVDEATDTAVTTSLNDEFYQVTFTGDDNVTLKQWNFTTEQYEGTSHDNIAYTPDPADGDAYMGGGKLALVQNIDIMTKDFNPFVEAGSHIKMSYTDFMTDATPNSAVSIDLFVNSSLSVKANILAGNQEVETAITQFGSITNITQDDPAQVTAPDHGIQSNQVITIRGVEGMTEVNGGLYTITYVDDDNFTLGVDSSMFTLYDSGGEWYTQGYRFYLPGSNYAWHRFYATCFGQYISYRIFYDDNLMNTIDTHQSGYELNAMQLWLRKGGRIVL